ncbi:hypothetical protein CDD82_2597 [Ophiocordyceps australis]|uniref:Hydrophobin n=1 Tax=Ophiocordyceps australis TaxID=1399860 RepID=A0A2C5XQZ2_9HYPO|nr:hypothetical protein CDD82_631 [Ophiocordyceps australis]PHH79106.1 hypothetical protein CDD82_2597 [Ophiocordyceps australis]
MKFFNIIAMAIGVFGASDLCPDNTNTPLCCSSGLHVFAVDCETPEPYPADIEEFMDTCAEVGLSARCCLTVADDVGIDCQGPL